MAASLFFVPLPREGRHEMESLCLPFCSNDLSDCGEMRPRSVFRLRTFLLRDWPVAFLILSHHCPRHLEQQEPVPFTGLTEVAAEVGEHSRVASGFAPEKLGRTLRRVPLEQSRLPVSVIEKVVERKFHRFHQLLERLHRRSGVAVFDARNIATQDHGACFDIDMG